MVLMADEGFLLNLALKLVAQKLFLNFERYFFAYENS